MFDGGGAIAVGGVSRRFHGRGSCADSLRVDSVGVGDVEVEIGLLRLALSFVDFERGTGHFDGGVVNYAIWRFVDAGGLGAESRFDEWNHVVGVAKMERGLNGEDAFRATTRRLACSAVPGVADGLVGFAASIAVTM